jgi:NAD(P)-dependent dehydrogenase (short-subunit alcohol dehydrogenase family)
MSQETILVTGAAGGVGSTAPTAIATLEQGHHVRANLEASFVRERLKCPSTSTIGAAASFVQPQ